MIYVWGFIAFMLLVGIVSALHARSIDEPLENETYLADNPELRELKDDKED